MSTPMISRFERWAPMAGIVFVLLMIGGGFLVSDVPNSDAANHEIAGYLADGDNHTRNIIGAYLWVIGALAFLCFLTRLRGDLRRAEGGTGALSNLAFGAGVAFAAVWMVSAAAYASVAFAIGLADAPVSDPDLVRVLPSLGGLLLLVGGGFAGSSPHGGRFRCDPSNGCTPALARLARDRGRDCPALRSRLPEHLPALGLGVHRFRRDAQATRADGDDRGFARTPSRARRSGLTRGATRDGTEAFEKAA